MKIKIIFFVLAAALVCGKIGVAEAAGNTISVARAFYELARQNNTQKIEALLARGYSIESVDDRGYNSICISVIRQNHAAYEVLTSYGADKNPKCLQKIPDSAYRRFFGLSPRQTPVKSYEPDSPYLIGTAALAVGTVAAAYIFRGDTGGGNGGGDTPTPTPDPDPEPEDKCPPNSHLSNGSCVCNIGYGNYGDSPNCHATVDNCSVQEADQCKACEGGYVLENNVCYALIDHCIAQTGRTCSQCETGFGIHGGDGSKCYRNIEYCKKQYMDVCQECETGYGTYSDDKRCYKTIEKCLNQVQDVCKQCMPGYDTYGDPYKCYMNNPCASYPNSVPAEAGSTCVCNVDKGYMGDPYGEGCYQTIGGEYQEGDEDNEEWNNYNELYCNSHGKYDTDTKRCLCYTGYTGEKCSECRANYLNFGGMCFSDLECSKKGAHLVQEYDSCVCDIENGYIPYYDETGRMGCMAEISCDLHHEQIGPDECACKANFDENCEKCIEGFAYDSISDRCLRSEYICEEKWTGENCDICPAQFKITVDESGTHCGFECADNRAPISENPSCENCASGYEFSSIDNTCVTTECTTGVEGYIKDEETGECRCDTANGWRMSVSGVCERTEDDLIGLSDTNINNANITVVNDGVLRDVYGMKPIMEKDEEGNITYYDSVYNALTSSGENEGTIDITNSNTGGNFVYGIYSQSDIYNGAVINNTTTECDGCNNVASGIINIKDDNTFSEIYGMYNSSENNMYNSFAYGSGQGATNNVSSGSINITKSETSNGNITGMQGGKNLYNAYANTNDGINTNVNATANITITHKGYGVVAGIMGTNSAGRINNSLAYLDSAVSNAVAEGSIVLSGKGTVYGIYGKGTIANSETRFNKNYAMLKEFSSHGIINVTTESDIAAAYGIYAAGSRDNKTSVYNAMGYNSIGDITVRNTSGGSGIGIYSATQTYIGEDNVSYYNNTYNAFRSSAIYGDGIASGNIDITVEGHSSLSQQIIGIYAAGNAYNSYSNSGSDVTLETIGNISINDKSDTGNMNLRGIESVGKTIANAYSTGQNQNTTTKVTGNINVNILATKNGLSSASGIFSDSINPQGSEIYNAALVNDKNNVEGNITVNSSSGRAPNRMYGIYATSYKTGESAGDAQPKTVYNAYYENGTEVSEGKVRGNISVLAKNATLNSNGEYYGIYIQDGVAYNTYSTNSDADVVGTITVDVVGGANGGTAAGMYGSNATLNNSGAGSSINVTSKGKASAYGMKGDNAHITNNAEISVNSTDGADAYGIYVNKGSAINDISGVINVSGDGNNYGIYAISDGTVSGKAIVINRGTISLSGSGNNTGIYAAGETATVSNTGTININGEGCSGDDCNNSSSIVLENGATFDNSGTTSSSGSLNFNEWGGNVVLSQGGKFEAEGSISGDLQVSSNVVTNTFETVSMVEDAFAADDVGGINLSSKSYLYNAGIKENDAGGYDAIMEMKNFNEVTNGDMAAYLEENYANEKNEELFNALKTVSTAREYRQTEADIAGTSTLPNIAQENLKVQRSLDRAMMAHLFKDGDDVRKMVGADGLYIGRDDHGTLSGYDITSQSMYALYDKKMDNNYRLGLGLSFTHTDTDYNNDSSRKSFMVQGYIPLTYTNNRGLTAVSMARFGFADGDYKRRGYGNTYEADTTEITYGWLNELRYAMKLGAVNLTPFAGLNAIGWYQDEINEGNDALALQIASSHILSLEGALGLYIDKDVEFAADNKLNVALGIGYYHEFADPYRGLDAQINDTIGTYKLRDIEHLNSRNRGILSAKVNYDYKDFSIYGELMQYLEKEHPIKVDVGLKYKF